MKSLCVSCKYFKPESVKCTKFATVDVISGNLTHYSATMMRKEKCGIEKPIYYESIRNELEYGKSFAHNLNQQKSLGISSNIFLGSFAGLIAWKYFNNVSLSDSILSTANMNSSLILPSILMCSSVASFSHLSLLAINSYYLTESIKRRIDKINMADGTLSATMDNYYEYSDDETFRIDTLTINDEKYRS